MTAHLYWRINVSANAGDTSFLALAEVEMRATVGGADQCAGGTASASSTDAASPAASAFDNDASTRWSTASGVLVGWLRYQFPAPVEVAQYTLQAHPTTPARSPSVWALEYSDDGTNWTAVEDRQASTWASGEIKTFTVASSRARVSQSVAEVLRINTAARATASQVAIEVLRPNPGVLGIFSQVAIEVLRPNTDVIVASAARPQVFVCT